MKKAILFFLLTLGALNVEGRTLSVLSLNLHYWGKGGEANGSLQDEFRTRWLHEFLEPLITDSQVFVFQEVVDTPSLLSMLGSELNCVSYQHADPEHQHIVMCTKKPLSLKPPAGKIDFAMHDLQTSIHLRPGVWATITENGKPIVNILGVHLKAGVASKDRRFDQLKIIKNVFGAETEQKWIIIGDFNLHKTIIKAEDEEWVDNEITQAETLLSPMNHLTGNYMYTFNSYPLRAQLDHVWIHNFIGNKASSKMIGPCDSKEPGKRFTDMRFYNRFISDHCPILVSVEVE